MEPPQPTQEQAADSIVLEEEIDPNYVPSEPEVLEYVKWLGMDLEADKDLFWIAREGLMAPLPANWKPCKIKGTDDIYYFNFSTGESTWDHPCDEYYKRLYEEEKKKKEIALKENNDQKRAQAKQDIQTLIGKKEKKPKKTKPEVLPLNELKQDAPLGPVLDRKPLPGLKLANPLPLGTIDKREDSNLGSSNSMDNRGSLGIKPLEETARLGSLHQSESKLIPLGKLPLESKQSKEIPEVFRSGDIKPVDDRPLQTTTLSIEVDHRTEAKPILDSNDSPDGVRNSASSSNKSQRNFLTFRGLDEESQQKAIAANLRMSGERKEELSVPKEDLRPLVTQLEQENAKLLSKLAFNEIELKNCKNELDMMTLTIDKHRGVIEELNKVKSELLGKEEDLFSVKAKLRSTEYDNGLLQDQLKSKDLDIQRAKLKFEEEIESCRVKVKALDAQCSSTKEVLETKELELSRLRANDNAKDNIAALSSTISHLEQENLSLRNDLSSKSHQLEQLNSQLQSIQSDAKAELVKKDELIGETQAKHKKEVDILNQQIGELQQQLTNQRSAFITSPVLQVDNATLDSLKATITQLEKQNKELHEVFNSTVIEKDTKIVDLNGTIEKLHSELDCKVNEHNRSDSEIRKALDDSKVLLQQTMDKLTGAEDHIQKLKTLLSEKTRECCDLSSQLSDLNSKVSVIHEKEKEITSLRSTAEHLKSQYQNAKDLLDTKEREFSQTNSTIKALQSQLTDEKERHEESIKTSEITIKHLQNEITLLSAQKNQVVDTNSFIFATSYDDEQLKFKLAEAEECIRNEKYKLQLNGLEIEKLKQLLELKENALVNMSKKGDELLAAMTRIRTLELDHSNTAQALQEKELEISNLSLQIEDSKLEVSKLKTENLRLNDIINTKDREISNLKAELTDLGIGAALHSATTSTTTILVASKTEEIKALKDSLRISRSDNEKLQNDLLSLRAASVTISNELENERSKVRMLEMEIEHYKELVQSSKATERTQLDVKDQENAKLRLKVRELESKVNDDRKFYENLQEELNRAKQDNEELTHQLTTERDANQQKDKKIRSFREELLQLQKRMSEKDANNSVSVSPAKPLTITLSSSTQTDPLPVVTQPPAPQSSVKHVRTESKAVQCSTIMVDKDALANVRQCMYDASIQAEVRRSNQGCQYDVSIQTPDTPPVRDDLKATINDGLDDIRVELDKRRAESASLFELIKNYESRLTQITHDQYNKPNLPASKSEEKTGPSGQSRLPLPSHYGNSYDDPQIHGRSELRKKRDSVEDCFRVDDEEENENIDRSPRSELESVMSSTSEELKSLSELRSTLANSMLKKDQFSADKILESMSTMFSSLHSCIYQLKLHTTKCGRALSRFEQLYATNPSAAQHHLNDIFPVFAARSDAEVEFLKTLSQWLLVGKSLIKDGRTEIDRLKSSWKKASSGNNKRSEFTLDRDQINSLTADLNVTIRLVRLIQDTLQQRGKLVRSVGNLKKKRPTGKQGLSGCLNRIETTNEKFLLLDTDLDELHRNVAEIMRPILQTPHNSGLGFDNEDDPVIPITQLTSRVPSSGRVQMGLPDDLHVPGPDTFAAPQPRFQNFVSSCSHYDAENVYPSANRLRYSQYHAIPSSTGTHFITEVSNHPVNPRVQLISHSATSMQSYNNRLTDIQKQIHAVQSKQADSLNECDRHVNWLSGLIKEIDLNTVPSKSTEVSNPSSKAFSSLDQFIL